MRDRNRLRRMVTEIGMFLMFIGTVYSDAPTLLLNDFKMDKKIDKLETFENKEWSFMLKFPCFKRSLSCGPTIVNCRAIEPVELASHHREQVDESISTTLYNSPKVFDHNNDSYIDHDEIKSTMHFLGETVTDDDVRAMIKEADADHDGLVDFEGNKASWRTSTSILVSPDVFQL
ncbi:hypothetical protein ACTXT7_010006 [Hymenolepis weldensis]